MNIVFWGKGNRGIGCLKALSKKGYKIDLVVGHPEGDFSNKDPFVETAKNLKIKTVQPGDPNSKEFERTIRSMKPDLFILAGYGKILKQNIINVPKIMCVNLHGGKLPKYRGSSPLNWSLINNEKSFTLSVIKIDSGVDTGSILLERTFSIGVNDTIRDFHDIANREFPLMLEKVASSIKKGSCRPKKQNKKNASYYPLRFPEDGLILWDIYTAQEIHDRIRALTEPYPCAYTFFKGRKVKLISSELLDYPYCGEPGRIYMKLKRGLLICASDKCLVVRKAFFTDNNELLYSAAKRYERLATVAGTVEGMLTSQDIR